MKRIIFLLLAVVVTIALTACGGPEPTKTSGTSIDSVVKRVEQVENRLAQAESKLTKVDSDKVTSIETQVNTIKTQITNLQNDINNIETPDLSDIYTQIEDVLTNMETVTTILNENTEAVDVFQAGLDDLQAQIDEIEIPDYEPPDLSNINSAIADLASTIVDLEARIEELEAEPAPPTTTPVEKAIDYTLIKYGNPVLKAGQTDMEYLFRLNITNTGTQDLTDIGISITFIANNAPAFTGTPMLSGGTVYWGTTNKETGLIQFVSGWGSLTQSTRLALESGETKSYYLKLEASFVAAPVSDVTWTIETLVGYLN